MTHTKEPWHRKGVNILVMENWHDSEWENLVASAEYEEDAKRIVACVNYCAGMTDEELQEGRNV